jgi:hypothetical protein
MLPDWQRGFALLCVKSRIPQAILQRTRVAARIIAAA